MSVVFVIVVFNFLFILVKIECLVMFVIEVYVKLVIIIGSLVVIIVMFVNLMNVIGVIEMLECVIKFII